MITGTATSGQPAEEPPREGSDPDTLEAAAVDGTAVAEPGDTAGTRAAGEAEPGDTAGATAPAEPEERPGGEADPRPAPRFWKSNRHVIALSVLCALSAALNWTLSLLRFAHFQVSTYDLVIFDQAVRGYSHFSAPTVRCAGSPAASAWTTSSSPTTSRRSWPCWRPSTGCTTGPRRCS
ncbi:hypothetical protein [Microbispora sp. GKU 823]|uniref:hypothetical protein n=1 Tax=Microbispora sp. GKU 823 TaxID=1652100 RepID=UPI001180B9A0|nr:hypothetical protein [Microbispora sp. GKU 823]